MSRVKEKLKHELMMLGLKYPPHLLCFRPLRRVTTRLWTKCIVLFIREQVSEYERIMSPDYVMAKYPLQQGIAGFTALLPVALIYDALGLRENKKREEHINDITTDRPEENGGNTADLKQDKR